MDGQSFRLDDHGHYVALMFVSRNYFMKLYVVAVTLFLITGCTNSEDLSVDSGKASQQDSFTVQHFGPMREVMRDGKTHSRIQLSDAIEEPHAFAVGALEGLAGEVTIIDGDVWVSRVSPDGELLLTGPKPGGDAATLMSISNVPEWTEMKIDSSYTGVELELLIQRFASSVGIDTTNPFPFMIKGEFKNLNLHVINGYCPIATDPATQTRKPWRNPAFTNADFTIVGFYARNSVAVMTHHGTAIHAHAFGMADGTQVMGHVDSMTAEPGMVLSIPKRE